MIDAVGWKHTRPSRYEMLARGNLEFSQVFRVTLQCDRPSAAAFHCESVPETVIVKLPGADRASRDREAETAMYVREARVYERLTWLGGGFQPAMYAVSMDERIGVAALMMEDVGAPPSRSDWDPHRVTTALQNLAAIHSEYWRDADLADQWWMRNCHRADIFGEPIALFAEKWDVLLKAGWQQTLMTSPAMQGIGHYLKRHLSDVLDELDARPPTLAHGDLHYENMLWRWSSDDDAEPVGSPVLIDWQDAVYGGCSSDVSKFISTSLEAQTAAQFEDELLRRYYASLSENARSDYDAKRFARDYELAKLSTLANYVIAASVSVENPADGALDSVNRSLLRVGRFLALADPLKRMD